MAALWQRAAFRQLTAVTAQGHLPGWPSSQLAVAGVQTVVKVQGSGTSSLRKDLGETWTECQSPGQVSAGWDLATDLVGAWEPS